MDLHHATFLSSQGGVECGFHNEGLGENEFGGEALSLLAVEVVEEDLVVGYPTKQVHLWIHWAVSLPISRGGFGWR